MGTVLNVLVSSSILAGGGGGGGRRGLIICFAASQSCFHNQLLKINKQFYSYLKFYLFCCCCCCFHTALEDYTDCTHVDYNHDILLLEIPYTNYHIDSTCHVVLLLLTVPMCKKNSLHNILFQPLKDFSTFAKENATN